MSHLTTTTSPHTQHPRDVALSRTTKFLCYFFGAPFAQDAGLIFLSRMTTEVAGKVLLAGGTAEEAVATALAATALATASMGVALVLIGKLKLARFVAYLPMPVVSEGGGGVSVFTRASCTPLC